MPKHDWYLKEWLATLQKRQADLVKDLDLNKGKVSLLASCKQQYMRDDVNLLSAYLSIEPFELLMHPSDAMAMRRLKADVVRIANSVADQSESASIQSAQKNVSTS